MKCFCNPIGWLTTCALAILVGTGCEQPSAPVNPTVAPAKPTPEASFELIASTFKRRVEDTPSGFVAPKAGGHSRLIASNNVTSELKPPAKAGEPYRGTITVVSQSRYALARTGDDSDKDEPDETSNERSSSGSLDDPSGLDSGVEIVDPGIVRPSNGEGGGRRPLPAEGTVTRRVDKEERIYDLEHQNGRWVLLTKPNPDTERSIQSAFEEALNTQI